MRRQTTPRPELSAAKQRGYYSIGEAAELTGVTPKMIRHYEEAGLIPPAQRTFANYRLYGEADLHRLRFIRRARRLGFGMPQIASLLGLWSNPGRASAEVKRLAREHVVELERKIEELQAMQRALRDLVQHCHGDHRPDCPILDDLAERR